MFLTKIMDIGEIVSLVLGSVAVGWQVYNTIRDRSKVIVDYKTNMTLFENGRYDTNKKYFIITVINKGRRPVNIASAGLKVRAKGKDKYDNLVARDSYFCGKRVLTETDPSTTFAMEQSLINFETIEYVWALDATGKMYKRRFKTKL